MHSHVGDQEVTLNHEPTDTQFASS